MVTKMYEINVFLILSPRVNINYTYYSFLNDDRFIEMY